MQRLVTCELRRQGAASLSICHPRSLNCREFTKPYRRAAKRELRNGLDEHERLVGYHISGRLEERNATIEPGRQRCPSFAPDR